MTCYLQAHTVLEMSYTEQQLTAAVVSEGLRPALAGSESGAPPNLLSLIQRCWDSDPHNRPSFDDIAKELERISEHINIVTEHKSVLVEPASSSLGYQMGSINWFTQGSNFSKRTYPETTSGVSMWLGSSNSVAYLPVLSWGSFATCGRREAMEDTHFLTPNMCNEKDIHLFGIFDGHRGAVEAF